MSVSEAQKRATAKHLKEQYKELRFRVKKEQAQAIEARAATLGLSFRAYVLSLIERDMHVLDKSKNQIDSKQ